jgi:hypothetical protein
MAVDKKYELREYVQKVSSIALKKFDLTVSKSKVPLSKKPGVRHLISLTNLRTILSILLSCEQVSIVKDCIENCNKLIESAESARLKYLELNDRGNVIYIEQF